MKICLCCKQSDIKPTCSFYCRFCYNYLQHKYGIDVMDYRIYFKMMYTKRIHVEDCPYKGLHEIHNHFMCKLRVTDKPLAELLEIALVLGANALTWK